MGQLLVAAAGRPLRVERVEAEHAEHRAHRAEGAGDRGVVAVGQGGVALADGLVDRGDAAGVPRSSSSAAVNSAQSTGLPASAPTRSAARRTKDSSRR